MCNGSGCCLIGPDQTTKPMRGMASLPASCAVDKPLKLGNTFIGEGDGQEGYYTMKLDFQPESMQQTNTADLLLLGADQLKLIPLPDDGSDCPFHFEGSLEHLQQRPGGDVECIAYFDGNEWTLQLVQAHLRAKHRPGVPRIPGYNADMPEEPVPAADQHAANVAAVQQQLQASSIQQHHAAQAAVHEEHEIDPDLDDALEEALFATDRASSQPQQSDPDQGPHSTAAVTQPVSGPEVHSQPHKPPQQPVQQQQAQQQHQAQPQAQAVQQRHQAAHPQQQHQQQHQQPSPPQPAAPPAAAAAPAAAAEEDDDSADDDSDDPWNTFDATAAPAPVPPAPKPAAVPPMAMPGHPNRHMSAVGGSSMHRSATPQPVAAAVPQQQQPPMQARPASAPPVQPVAAAAPVPAAAGSSGMSRGAVSVLGGDEEEEEEAGQDAQECSEDESDGVGVEYF